MAFLSRAVPRVVLQGLILPFPIESSVVAQKSRAFALLV
jgi:hypothetical protein